MNIFFKGKDNSVAIMTLAEGADKYEAIEKFMESHPGFYTVLNMGMIVPNDRTFRDAWVIRNNKIEVDQKIAKEIYLNRLRQVRDEKLKELDVESMKVLTDPVKLQEVEDKKQKLRDLPKNIKFDYKNPVEIGDWF